MILILRFILNALDTKIRVQIELDYFNYKNIDAIDYQKNVYNPSIEVGGRGESDWRREGEGERERE